MDNKEVKINRITGVLSLLVFCAVIVILGTIFVLSPDSEYSEIEKRSLQTFPLFESETFFSGEFSAGINIYFADQFPFRDGLVRLKNLSERGLLKRENNGVIKGKEDYLAVRSFNIYDGRGYVGPTDYYSTRVLDVQMDSVKKIKEGLESSGIRFGILTPPRTVDVAGEMFALPAEHNNGLTDYIAKGLSECNHIDILPVMKEKVQAGEYVYYKTDHHFTSLGAYYTYVEVMREFGLESLVVPLEEFEKEKVSEDFYGTTWSKGGYYETPGDEIFFYHYIYAQDGDYSVLSDGRELGGFFDRERLGDMDQYSAFIGGNSQKTLITKKGEERPKLLMVKDSFGLSLAPFLALHFDMEIINVAAREQITKIAKEGGFDYVLVVYNVENLITSGDLAYNK